MRWHWQASCVVCAVVVVLLFVSLSAGDMSLDEEKDQGSLIFFASLLKPTQDKYICVVSACKSESFRLTGMMRESIYLYLLMDGSIHLSSHPARTRTTHTESLASLSVLKTPDRRL